MGDNRSQSQSRKSTTKQEKFAQAIIHDMGQSEAYKLAYDTSDILLATIHNSAYKLMRHGEIAREPLMHAKG